jgi:hypothetical protein
MIPNNFFDFSQNFPRFEGFVRPTVKGSNNSAKKERTQNISVNNIFLKSTKEPREAAYLSW